MKLLFSDAVSIHGTTVRGIRVGVMGYICGGGSADGMEYTLTHV